MDKLSLESFNWGWMGNDSGELITFPDGTSILSSQFHREQIINEIFNSNIYEKFFEVEKGDVVLDIGASHGPFTYSILHKEPAHVYCLEPSEEEFPILVRNTRGFPVTHINMGLSSENKSLYNDQVFGSNKMMDGITFEKLISSYSLDKIDFLKTDCEGGEYEIFKMENLDYVKNNIKKIAGEWHLYTINEKNKFRHFRDNMLTHFQNYNVFSVDNVDIKWDLWNEHFIEYYNQVIFYIDNRFS